MNPDILYHIIIMISIYRIDRDASFPRKVTGKYRRPTEVDDAAMLRRKSTDTVNNSAEDSRKDRREGLNGLELLDMLGMRVVVKESEVRKVVLRGLEHSYDRVEQCTKTSTCLRH